MFIGTGLDREAICNALNGALVTSCDFTPQAWRNLPDPFPQWGAKAA